MATLSCPYLTQLVFTFGLFPTAISSITNAEVIPLVQTCIHLEKLCLDDCVALTDDALAAIGENCSKLKALSLAGLPHITLQGLGSIVQGCPLLGKLDERGRVKGAVRAYMH
jgi:hypothetical protein